MFEPRSKAITVDGVAMTVREMSAKKALQIAAMDGWAGTQAMIFEITRNADGTPFFGNVAEIDSIPSHVVRAVTDALNELNEAKN